MGPVEVLLEHARWRHFGWLLFGLGSGAVLLYKLGVVGQVLGGIMLLVAARHGLRFVRTLLYPAGTISVQDQQLVLPSGLCRGQKHTFPMDQVRHAFFLRRAVPWTETGPLLVIEAGNRAFAYPRDWFASEGDQQRVVRAIHAHLGRAAE